MPRRPTRVEFMGGSGAKLVGKLHAPTGPRLGTAVFAHCFTCSKDFHAARGIAAALAEQGIATLRFDFTGLGESAGAFEDSDFSSDVGDLLAAAAWLEKYHSAPTLLVGHSLGGAAVYEAASRLPSCKAVASIGAPSDPAHVEGLFGEDVERIREAGSAEVMLGGRPFRVSASFFDDLYEQRLLETVEELRKPVLILHSPTDSVVGVKHARKLFESARHPKSFVSLDGADHLLGNLEDARYAGAVIATWARRYALSSESRRRADHDSDVEVHTGEGFASDVVVRGMHRLRADEPESLGGTDTGPTPFELVSAGLGACTSITLRMYADRKEWPLDSVTVHVDHEARTFSRTIELEGELDPEQHARLMQIADRCPVHRLLEGGAEIVTHQG